MSVKVNPKDKQSFKTFQVEMIDITWEKRCELNDKMIEIQGAADGRIPPFSFWGDIVLDYTTLTADKLNRYSTDEIIGIANAVFEVANSKKK